MNYLPISVSDEPGLGLGFRDSVLEVLVALLVTSYQRMSIYYTMPDGERGFPKSGGSYMYSFVVVATLLEEKKLNSLERQV